MTTTLSAKNKARRADARSNQLVIIDASFAQPERLTAALLPNVAVLMLETEDDGVAQITELLHHSPQISELHIFAPNSPGSLSLGNRQLNLLTLEQYAWDLQSWFSASHTSASSLPRLFLYARQVAAETSGIEFVQKLHMLTGAQIAISTERNQQDWVFTMHYPQPETPYLSPFASR